MTKKGFTLIELAIVIVIIGLITGGVLGAQSLINSAKVNQEISNIQKMGTAIRAFELEFDDMPGDMTNAYDYFGSDCGNDNSGASSSGCNGDGDKCIDQSPTTTCSTGGAGFGYDMRHFFVHLAMSGIYPELVTWAGPEYTSAADGCRVGEHLNSSSVGEGVYIIHSMIPRKYSMYYFSSQGHTAYCNLLGSGQGFVKPKDMKKIDEKLDDGNGRRGIIQAKRQFSAGGDIYEGTDCMDIDGNYALDESDNACTMKVELNK